MKKIKLMNKIAKCGTDRFSSYNYEYNENILSPMLLWYARQICTTMISAMSLKL